MSSCWWRASLVGWSPSNVFDVWNIFWWVQGHFSSRLLGTKKHLDISWLFGYCGANLTSWETRRFVQGIRVTFNGVCWGVLLKPGFIWIHCFLVYLLPGHFQEVWVTSSTQMFSDLRCQTRFQGLWCFWKIQGVFICLKIQWIDPCEKKTLVV